MMDSEKKTTVFNSGIPTQADVDRIMKAFGVPEVGVVIPYDSVAGVMHEPKTGSRFQTVTMAWRKKVYRDHNIRIGCEKGKGFKALTNSERVDECGGRYKGGLRKIRVAGDLAIKTGDEGLAPEEVRVKHHVAMASAALRLAAATEAKRIKYPDMDGKK